MRKFYILIHGSDFWVRNEKGKPERYAFYQNHWIEAHDEGTAANLAMARARNDPRLAMVDLLHEVSSMQLRVKEVREVDSIDDVGSNPSGFNLYKSPNWWEFWKPALWLNLSPW